MGTHAWEWTNAHTVQCPARLKQECHQRTRHRLRGPHPLHPVGSWKPEAGGAGRCHRCQKPVHSLEQIGAVLTMLISCSAEAALTLGSPGKEVG